MGQLLGQQFFKCRWNSVRELGWDEKLNLFLVATMHYYILFRNLQKRSITCMELGPTRKRNQPPQGEFFARIFLKHEPWDPIWMKKFQPTIELHY